MLIFGLLQERLLPDALHWVIQVLHLLLGLSALGPGEIITRQYKRFKRRATPESLPQYLLLWHPLQVDERADVARMNILSQYCILR